jgi:hypothetical protein
MALDIKVTREEQPVTKRTDVVIDERLYSTDFLMQLEGYCTSANVEKEVIDLGKEIVNKVSKRNDN